MKKILASILLTILFFGNGIAQSNCRTGSMFMGMNYFSPSQTAGVIAFSTDLVFLKRYHRGYNTSFGIEVNAGSRKYDKVIEDVIFEGGYKGYVDYSISRFESWGKMLIGKRINNVVEFIVPLKIGYRRLGYKQYFDIYSGQVIDPEDIVDSGEDVENSNLIGAYNNIGVGTGLSVAFLPTSGISPFFEVNYTLFNNTTNYEVENSTINQGVINTPQTVYSNTNTLNFKVGFRFNFGTCPIKTGDIFKPSVVNKRNNKFSKGTSVSTSRTEEAAPNSNITSGSNNTKKEPKPNIRLKPSIPLTRPIPSTPKPVIPN